MLGAPQHAPACDAFRFKMLYLLMKEGDQMLVENAEYDFRYHNRGIGPQGAVGIVKK